MTPRKPNTTEGIPASSSMVGFRTVTQRGGENSARVMAQARDSGTPSTMAFKVTAREEMIMERIPK